MRLNELIGEANEGIAVHHASGHFTREQALERLVANGLTETAANELLDQPVDPAKFDEWKTWPKDRSAETCPVCGGDGEMECETCAGDGDVDGVTCDDCIGTGRIECIECEGN